MRNWRHVTNRTYFNTSFSDGQADTIGGIVLNAFGHMPEKDEVVTLENIEFKVTNADNRRLIQLKVTLPKMAEEPQQVADRGRLQADGRRRPPRVGLSPRRQPSTGHSPRCQRLPDPGSPLGQ